MTLQELINEVQAVPEVLEVVTANPKNTQWSFQQILISYLYQVKDGRLLDGSFNVYKEPDTVIESEIEGEPDTVVEGQVFFYKNKPAILRESVTQRNSFMSTQEIIDYIELNNTGWTVINIILNIRNGFDSALLDVDNGTEVIKKEFRIWSDDNIDQWVQPTGAHDSYALDAKVMHNEKIWKSLQADNVWEPTVNNSTLWEEVDPSSLMNIKPVQTSV